MHMVHMFRTAHSRHGRLIARCIPTYGEDVTIMKKTYVKPSLFNQGDFSKKTAGMFYASCKEYWSRRLCI